MSASRCTHRTLEPLAGSPDARLLGVLLLLAFLSACSVMRKPVPLLARPPQQPPVGVVAGEFVVPGVASAMADPLVVYLEPMEAEGEAAAAGRTSTVRQRAGELHPDFLAVARGDAVRFVNEDEVFQQVFSTSRPNQFDTGLLRRGGAKVVPMRHPGVVRVYSALDETTSGVIYVAPSPYFAVVYPPGRFELADVPAGRYELRTWREEGASVSRRLQVRPGARSSLEIEVEATGAIP